MAPYFARNCPTAGGLPRTLACPDAFTGLRGTLFRVQAGKGGMFQQGFGELNLTAQNKFGGRSRQTPNPPLGAADPKVRPTARTACPDALTGSGASDVGQVLRDDFELEFTAYIGGQELYLTDLAERVACVPGWAALT